MQAGSSGRKPTGSARPPNRSRMAPARARFGEADMAGVLPGRCFDAGRLTRFGYVTLRAKKDNLLCRAGEAIRGHEFHHWDAPDGGAHGLVCRQPLPVELRISAAQVDAVDVLRQGGVLQGAEGDQLRPHVLQDLQAVLIVKAERLRLYAGFPHFHFCANPEFAKNFYEACLKEKRHAESHQAHGHREVQL